MSSTNSFAGKVKELIEEMSGCPYEVRYEEGRLLWRSVASAPTAEGGRSDHRPTPDVPWPPIHADGRSIEVGSMGPDMMHVLEHSCNIRLCAYGEFNKFLDPSVRKRLEKIIPAIVIDYEIVCRGIEDATREYGLPKDELRVCDAGCMDFRAKFEVRDMADDELLRAIEKTFRAYSTISRKLLDWWGPRFENSIERQALIDRGVRVPGLLGRLRRKGLLVLDWPPSSRKRDYDAKITADVREYLENNWAEVFTPEGRLKLVNGEIVLLEPKRKK